MEGGRIETKKRRKEGWRKKGRMDKTMEGKSKRQMDRWKERQEEGSSKIRKTVDSGILISTISKGVNILVKHFMGKETTSLFTVL